MSQSTPAERIIKFETLHSGWSTFGIASVRLPDGLIVRREVEDHGSAAAVLPYDPQRRSAVLVRQFRAAISHVGEAAWTLEVPAGLMEQEAPEDCARREVLEETGLALGNLERVATALSMPGVSTERIHLFLACFRPEQRVCEGGGVTHEHENISVVELGLDELAALADSGELIDLKTLALVLALRLRRPDLFQRKA